MSLNDIARLGLVVLALAFGGGRFAMAGSASAADEPALRALAGQLLEVNPQVSAARAALDAAEARQRAAGKPLYNPELEFDYEDAGSRTTSLGISQSIDWADKRGARADIGELELESARAGLALARQETLGRFLERLNALQTARASARLAERRVALLGEFQALAERRFAAGDVGQSDLDLARLALSQARMEAAGRAADAADAEAELRALVVDPPAAWPELPALPAPSSAAADEKLLEQHPGLKGMRLRALALRNGVTLAQRERRPDPTIGLRGGKEDDDALVGLNLSIPLFVRNDFRAEVDAAQAEALREEQAYRNAWLQGRARLMAAAERYRLMHAALTDWQNVGQKALSGRTELLKRLWEAGEIGTTEYLVQLEQTLDTQFSAVELLGRTWAAWIAWLDAAGQTERWLGTAPEQH